MIILGCGYIGQALAQRYRARGEPVLGVVRRLRRRRRGPEGRSLKELG